MGWHSDDAVKKFIDEGKCIVIDVGWILSETKDEIVIASKRMKWREDSNNHEWSGISKIPKTWIRKKLIFNQALKP